jgi:carboxylesterase type B
MTLVSFTLLVSLLLFRLPGSLSAPHPNTEQRDTPPSGPQVKTHGATFIGNTDDHYGVSTWLGIRYAQSPIGPLRLQPPKKTDNDGTIVAKSFGAECFQLPSPAGANISEDCLYLNIFKPSKAALREHGHHEDDEEGSDCLPVMFWIHGGGFNDGSGQIYDSRSLVNTSIALDTPTIVVTINYRLSFFGFSGT